MFVYDNPLSKITDKNNEKISYSCTNNISKIIYYHYKKSIDKIYWNNNDKSKQSCNCKIKNECPLGNTCNLNNILYQSNISTKETNTNGKAYIGITSLNWKFRYYNVHQSLKNPTLKNQTAQYKYYWYLKELGLTSIINWKIIKRFSSASSLHGRNNLCLEEIIYILKYRNTNLLNTRNELMTKCRHRNKFLE